MGSRDDIWQSNISLRNLCEANGILREHYLDDIAVTHLHCFMGGLELKTMTLMQAFGTLTTLCIIKQENVECINGLQFCSKLESLWISECCVREISGLESCNRLINLHLSSNSICQMEAVSHLSTLQVLWLNDNHITQVKGVEYLTNLRVLWLCSNKIVTIGTALLNNQRLEELNLSRNKISSFRDILYLSRLDSLKSLSLMDPHFGDNPICRLCNYQTYVTYHLAELQSLDMENISENAKRLAKAIYLKKKMYYNMRMKTLKLYATNITKKGVEMHIEKVDSIQQSRSALLRLQKEILRGDLAFSSHAAQTYTLLKEIFSDVSLDHADNNTLDIKPLLSLAIKAIETRILCVEHLLENMRKRIASISIFSSARILVEFDTGGNVRLEEGRASDSWFRNCAELVDSRFLAEEYWSTGITGIKVNRVIRIHNRYLRSRFDQRVQELIDDGACEKVKSKRAFEYLFYGEVPLLCQRARSDNEILRIAEEGFRLPEEYRELGYNSAVSLSSGILGADQERIFFHADLENQNMPNVKGNRVTQEVDLAVCHGQLIIVKAFVADCTEVEDTHGCPITGPITHSCVSSEKNRNPKHKQWLIFDNAIALPEYIISFEYSSGDRSISSDVLSLGSHTNCIGGIGGKETFSEQELIDYTPFLTPLIFFLQRLNSNWLDHKRKFGSLCDKARYAISALPSVTPIQSLTDSTILLKSKVTGSLFTIVDLNLHGIGICKIENLDACRNIKNLILSCNRIQRIEGLTSMQNLQALDLSFNLLKRLYGLAGISQLESLLLNNNLLERLEDLKLIRRHSICLCELDLRSNFICREKAYQTNILRGMTRLQILDGKPIPDSEKTLINMSMIELTVDHIRARMHPLVKQHVLEQKKMQIPPAESDWMLRVETLNVNHEGLVKLGNLGGLVNLRQASFAHNRITSVEGLIYCTSLEDLSLEDNRVDSCENLQYCRSLRKLDLSRNELRIIHNFENIGSLTQLSIENNFISSLSALVQLSVLMELYIGNNEIEHMQEIDHLKNLPKLIIMDLSGNLLCSLPDYRLYTLFRIRRLKVLDGSSVQIEEAAHARDKFSGKLTKDVIAGRLGHDSFSKVCYLEISLLKLRDLSVLGELNFSSLNELIAENNHLSDVPSLKNLCNLKVLKLNRNRIATSLRVSRNTMSTNENDTIEISASSTLEVLQLAHNRIADVRELQLHRYPRLQELQLQNNLICQVGGFGACGELKELDLSKNRIRQLIPGGVVGLSALRELRMEEAGLRSLVHLGPLKSLNHLYLAFNRINDIGELEKLAGVGCITEITMCNNPVARRQLYRPTLICQVSTVCWIDGREVTDDERERAEVFLNMERPLNFFLQEVRPMANESTSKQVAGRISPLNMGGNFSVGAASDPGVPNQRLPHRGGDLNRPSPSVPRRSLFLPQRA